MPRTTAGTRQAAGDRQAVRNFGTCLRFAGGAATNNVQFADSNSLDLTATLTLIAWVNPKSFGTSNAGRIIAKNNSGGTVGYDLLWDGANKAPRFIGNSTIYASSVANSIPAFNRWYQVVVTFDKDAGSNEIKFYVNGVPAGTNTRSTVINSNSDTLVIGNNHASTLNRCFDGRIDEVKAFNRALSATEVAKDFYGVPYDPTGLVLEARFDEESGTSAIDSSGNQANGTITGATYSGEVFMVPRTSAT